MLPLARAGNAASSAFIRPRLALAIQPPRPMSTLVLALGALGAVLGARTAWQLLTAARGNNEKFVKGGFKGKMDKAEALAVLGIKWVERCSVAFLTEATVPP